MSARPANPFRKPSQLQAITTDVEPSADTAPTGRRTSKQTKRVRIQTPPPLSPDTPADEQQPVWPTAPDYRTEVSSPPPPLSAANEKFMTPFPAVDQTLEQELQPDQEVLENTRRNSATDAAGMYTNGGTFNPFAKTLAPMESRYQEKLGQKSAAKTGVDWSAAERAAESKTVTAPPPKGSKQALDVDAFKRLLLTGKPGSASGAGDASAATSGSSAVDGRGAPMQPSIPDRKSKASGRDDFDDLESASSEDEEPPIPTTKKTDQFALQLPNRPAARAPQTVSFSEWDSFDSELSAPNPSQTSQPDLNKLLPSAAKPPPPPTRRLKAQSGDASSEIPTSISPTDLPPERSLPRPPRPRQTSSYSTTLEMPSPRTTTTTPTAATAIPPFPTAPRPRTHSNLSTHSSIASSNDPGIDTPPTPTMPTRAMAIPPPRRGSPASSISMMAAKGPPPPPTRRGAPKPPSIPSLTEDLASPLATESSDALRGGIPRIPSSSRSSPSASRPGALGAPGMGMGMGMPPPPPPRRRGSSKGSIEIGGGGGDSRRSSYAERVRTSRESGRPSLRELQLAEEEGDGEGGGQGERKGSDMFADLDALQREVDALMGRR